MFSSGVGSGECGVGIRVLGGWVVGSGKSEVGNCAPWVCCGEWGVSGGKSCPGPGSSNRSNFLQENLKLFPVDGHFCEKGVLNPRYFLRFTVPFRSRSDWPLVLLMHVCIL